MVLIAGCGAPFQIELQLGSGALERQLEKYGFNACFGGAPLQQKTIWKVMVLRPGLGEGLSTSMTIVVLFVWYLGRKTKNKKQK